MTPTDAELLLMFWLTSAVAFCCGCWWRDYEIRKGGRRR